MKVRLIALTFGLLLAVGLPLAATAGPLPGGPDTDGDGVEDQFDNCSAASNTNQADVDHDGCGDVCSLSCDINNDGTVSVIDFSILRGQFGGPPGTPSADCNGDGTVSVIDFSILRGQFGQSTGPSGLIAALKQPGCN